MKRLVFVLVAVIAVAAITGGSIAAAGGDNGAADAPDVSGVVRVSELLADPAYGTEVAIYGQVSLLGELFCPCFELRSGNKTVMVWYDLMVDEDGEARPAVNIEGIENGDWIVVTGELQPGGATPAEFWASGIDEAVNVSVEAGDNGGDVTLAVGDLLVVTLESNPTTGYAWSLAGAVEDDAIAFAGNDFIAPESAEPMVGQGGVEVWAFRALAAGEVTISMEYARPWEQGVEPVDTFGITVVVE